MWLSTASWFGCEDDVGLDFMENEPKDGKTQLKGPHSLVVMWNYVSVYGAAGRPVGALVNGSVVALCETMRFTTLQYNHQI